MLPAFARSARQIVHAHAMARYQDTVQWWSVNHEELFDRLLPATEEGAPEEEHALYFITCFTLQPYHRDLPDALLARAEALLSRWMPPAKMEECAVAATHDISFTAALFLGLMARHCCLHTGDIERAESIFTHLDRCIDKGIGSDPYLDESLTRVPLEDLLDILRLRLFILKGEFVQAYASCEALLARHGMADMTTVSGRALLPWGYLQELWTLKGILEQWHGQYERANISLLTSSTIALEHGGWHLATASLSMRAQLCHLEGDLQEARVQYDEIEALVRRHGLSEDEAYPIFVRVLKPFLYLECDQFELARSSSETLVRELSCTTSRLPLHLARAILIMASAACKKMELARVHFNILSMELGPGASRHPLAPLHEMLIWLWEPERVPTTELSPLTRSDRNLFLRFAERALGHLVGKLPTQQAWRYHPDGAWFEVPCEDGHTNRCDLSRRHTARRALLALIDAGSRGLSREDLIAKVWLDEQISHEAALTRMRVLIHQLRELGLREILLTTEHGYRLDQSVSFIAAH